jgi:hypothetical protein
MGLVGRYLTNATGRFKRFDVNRKRMLGYELDSSCKCCKSSIVRVLIRIHGHTSELICTSQSTISHSSGNIVSLRFDQL